MTTTELSYTDLLVMHSPSMPHDEAEHARLVAILESIELDGHTLSEAELRFTETLKVLVMEYENRICPPMVVPPLQTLQFLVEEQGLRQSDFVAEFGTKSYVSQIFTGRRPITSGVAAKLAKVLKVTPETFNTSGRPRQ